MAVNITGHTWFAGEFSGLPAKRNQKTYFPIFLRAPVLLLTLEIVYDKWKDAIIDIRIKRCQFNIQAIAKEQVVLV